jgi:hypothetical protein
MGDLFGPSCLTSSARLQFIRRRQIGKRADNDQPEISALELRLANRKVDLLMAWWHKFFGRKTPKARPDDRGASSEMISRVLNADAEGMADLLPELRARALSAIEAAGNRGLVPNEFLKQAAQRVEQASQVIENRTPATGPIRPHSDRRASSDQTSHLSPKEQADYRAALAAVSKRHAHIGSDELQVLSARVLNAAKATGISPFAALPVLEAQLIKIGERREVRANHSAQRADNNAAGRRGYVAKPPSRSL